MIRSLITSDFEINYISNPTPTLLRPKQTTLYSHWAFFKHSTEFSVVNFLNNRIRSSNNTLPCCVQKQLQQFMDSDSHEIRTRKM